MRTKFAKIFCIAITVCLSVPAAQASETLATRVEQTLKNWRSVTSEMLKEPGNADLLLALKAQAANPRAVEARVLLLNLGDPTTVQACLADLRREGSNDQAFALRALSLCSQPQLILALVDDLHRNESAKVKRAAAGEEISRIIPVSVLAARAIKHIILNSPQFRSDVKTWADQMQIGAGNSTEVENDRLRMRKWVKRNEALLRGSKYHLVEPERD